MSWDVLILNSDGTPEDLHNVPCGWMPNPIGEVSAVREQINSAFENIDKIEGLEGAMKDMRCQGKEL